MSFFPEVPFMHSRRTDADYTLIRCEYHLFKIPIAPGLELDRFVYSFIIYGKTQPSLIQVLPDAKH